MRFLPGTFRGSSDPEIRSFRRIRDSVKNGHQPTIKSIYNEMLFNVMFQPIWKPISKHGRLAKKALHHISHSKPAACCLQSLIIKPIDSDI